MSVKRVKRRKPGEVLHDLIQEAQGYSYISDALEDANERQAMEEANRSIYWHAECIRKLAEFTKPKRKI